jgi:hypothetical protein
MKCTLASLPKKPSRYSLEPTTRQLTSMALELKANEWRMFYILRIASRGWV